MMVVNSKIRKHIRYLQSVIHILKYEILNSALDGNINEIKVKLFKKYNRRLQLLKL
jgi:hypothetical protein